MKRKSSTLDDFDSQYCNRNCINCSTFFLATAMPPFGRTMKIFYRRLYIKRCVFCHFLARIVKFNNVWWSFVFPNFRKKGEFAVSIEHSGAKSVSASGGRSLPETETLFASKCWMETANSPIFLKFGNTKDYQTWLNFAILAGKWQKTHLFI